MRITLAAACDAYTLPPPCRPTALKPQYDCLVRPQYMAANLSDRGMVASVRALGELQRPAARLSTAPFLLETGAHLVHLSFVLVAGACTQRALHAACISTHCTLEGWLKRDGCSRKCDCLYAAHGVLPSVHALKPLLPAPHPPVAVERGMVRLCRDSDGRLVVALVNPLGDKALHTRSSSSGGDSSGSSNEAGGDSSASTAPAAAADTGNKAATKFEPVQLVLLYATPADAAAAGSGGQKIADMQLISPEWVDRELEKRELGEIPPGEVTPELGQAAMPAVMWSGPQVRCPCCGCGLVLFLTICVFRVPGLQT